ncbi:ARM repeat-containing protein [Ramaria rubella]|nr:ARM repeat-containing protein [Ramaria rubella]
MPRENRKRGKKHKTTSAEKAASENVFDSAYNSGFGDIDKVQAGPPFGLLDPDIKAYFRTVDDQLRDWQEGANISFGVDEDPNEERRMFFTAALSEMKGKELQLATDPDCSPVLERMLYSMDDTVRRVFADSLAGSWLTLSRDRFASHVCQTLLEVARDTVSREARGVVSTPLSSLDKGELLTMMQLVMNACEDLLPEVSGLIQNPFASHVLRALLLLLAPAQVMSPDFRSSKHAPSARSKKSASWKARKGSMKAIVPSETSGSQFDSDSVAERGGCITPNEFQKIASRILERVRETLDGNEVRALAVDKVASPVLQMLLELEASLGKANDFNSIMDRVLAGQVSEPEISPSSYVSALFLDATSSHLSESILTHCPTSVFDRVWECYFTDDLPKLAAHPIANFVVARGVERFDARKLEDAIARLRTMWRQALKFSRIGVLVAMVDRASQLSAHEASMVETICSMFELTSTTERTSFLHCVLRLKNVTVCHTLSNEYRNALTQVLTTGKGDHDVTNESQHSGRGTIYKHEQDLLEPKIQGSLLLQSVLRLHEPHNNIILESLYHLPQEELLAVACHAISSRVFDVAFESPTVSLQSRKRLVTSFLGQFHLLIDDRIGSRVADRCWDAADPYLKEKIARSLLPHEQFLPGSHFGRFFTRNLDLPLLRRNPGQWKILQSKKRKFSTAANVIPQGQTSCPPTNAEPVFDSSKVKSNSKRKRKQIGNEDEIDALFSGISAKKRVKGMEISTFPSNVQIHPDLDSGILDAIKSAPSGDKT